MKNVVLSLEMPETKHGHKFILLDKLFVCLES